MYKRQIQEAINAAGNGDTIFVHNGIYHENHSYAPIEFTVGSGNIIEGFDEAVLGMEEGETKTVTVPPEKGYGERQPELIWKIPSEAVSGEKPKEGSYVSIQGRPAKVVEVTEESITLDLNHPLAGRTLTFEITLRGIA